MPKQFPRVHVKWQDVAGRSYWDVRENGMSPVTCESVGFLIERKRDYIVLAQSFDHLGKVDHQLAIPRSQLRGKIVHLVEKQG